MTDPKDLPPALKRMITELRASGADVHIEVENLPEEDDEITQINSNAVRLDHGNVTVLIATTEEEVDAIIISTRDGEAVPQSISFDGEAAISLVKLMKHVTDRMEEA